MKIEFLFKQNIQLAIENPKYISPLSKQTFSKYKRKSKICFNTTKLGKHVFARNTFHRDSTSKMNSFRCTQQEFTQLNTVKKSSTHWIPLSTPGLIVATNTC